MKTFDELWTELSDRRPGPGPRVRHRPALDARRPCDREEAGRGGHWSPGWPPSTRAGCRAAEDISQLLYHAQGLMLATGLRLDDAYAHL